MKVLIVDTSVQILQRLEEMLSEMKSVGNIYKAVNYEEAVELCKENKISVVLLDSGLRDNGTINVLKYLKETGSVAAIIFLSTCYDDFILRECKSYNVDFIFDKYQEFYKITGIINSIAAKQE